MTFHTSGIIVTIYFVRSFNSISFDYSPTSLFLASPKIQFFRFSKSGSPFLKSFRYSNSGSLFSILQIFEQWFPFEYVV